jgi:hypothetical protein
MNERRIEGKEKGNKVKTGSEGEGVMNGLGGGGQLDYEWNKLKRPHLARCTVFTYCAASMVAKLPHTHICTQLNVKGCVRVRGGRIHIAW